jgi:hypothetical protein
MSTTQKAQQSGDWEELLLEVWSVVPFAIRLQGRLSVVGLEQGGGALIGNQLQAHEEVQQQQQEEINRQSSEVRRQREELQRLKKQGEY